MTLVVSSKKKINGMGVKPLVSVFVISLKGPTVSREIRTTAVHPSS